MQIEKIKMIKDPIITTLPWWEDIYWSVYRVWYKAYWYVYYTFKPQHKSIRDSIPKKWADLDGIVEDVLSAIIISFVEEEKGLDQLETIMESLNKDDEYLKNEWGSVDAFWNYYEGCYKDYLRLQSIYSWVKTGKKAMQNYLDSIEGFDNWREYEKVTQDMNDRDSEYLADLVKLRKYLWT
jgi:hypothetical protein